MGESESVEISESVGEEVSLLVVGWGRVQRWKGDEPLWLM